PRREALPLLWLPVLRRSVHIRDGDRRTGLQRGARGARRSLRGEARDRGGGPPGGCATRTARAVAWLARTSGGLLLPVPVGGRRSGRRSRVSAWTRARGAGAARVPGRIRAKRVGQD